MMTPSNNRRQRYGDYEDHETNVNYPTHSTIQKQHSSEEEAESRRRLKHLDASIYKGSTAKKQKVKKKKIDYTKVEGIIEERTPRAEETDDFHSCQEG